MKLRLGIAELLGTASEIQSVSQVGVYRTLDLQRHSFGASQLLYLPVKRVVDIVLGTVGCLITLPVAAVVKLSYLAAGDTHPIFYKQTRVGLRRQCFELWKLRSMAWDADEQLQRLLEDVSVNIFFTNSANLLLPIVENYFAIYTRALRCVVDSDQLAGHGDADLPARRHRHPDLFPNAPAGHRPFSPGSSDEHCGRHPLLAYIAHHLLQKPHVAHRPERLLLAHEQRRRRQSRAVVGLGVGAGLYVGDDRDQLRLVREIAVVGGEPCQEAVGALVFALGLRHAGSAQLQVEARLPRETPGSLGSDSPAAGNVTSEDMLSVSHSSGTPPIAFMAASQQARRSSAVRVLE